MKKKLLSVILCAAIFISVFSMGLTTVGAEGATAINSEADFLAMDPNGNYYLNADIQINNTYEQAFKGRFDGNGHTVTVKVPMFAEFNGVVNDLTIEGPEMKGNTDLAAFALYSENGFTAVNVVNKVNITVTGASDDNTKGFFAGAFLADSASVLDNIIVFRNCKNYGDITVETAVVKDATTGAEYDTFVGGFAGRLDGALIQYSENHGNITGAGNRAFVGGFIGRALHFASYNTFDVIDCTNTGEITSGYDAGSIIGYLGVSNNSIGIPYTIQYCVNTGDVTGGYRVGGFVGYCYASGSTTNYYIEIKNCVNIANVYAGRPATDLNGSAQYTYMSLIIGYSNSVYNLFEGNLIVGELIPLTGEGYNQPFRTINGCSSAKTLENQHNNNFYFDNNTTEWYTYATAESNVAQQIKIDVALEKQFITPVTDAEIKNGTVLEKLNSVAGSAVFSQKAGEYPTIDLGEREKRMNSDGFTLPEVSAGGNDPAVTTEEPPVTTAPSDNTTTEPDGENQTTTAPKDDNKTPTTTAAPSGGNDGEKKENKGCGSVIAGGSIAIVVTLGGALVLGKKRSRE